MKVVIPELPNFLELRKNSGLSLRQVESKTGISNAYLSQLETGRIKNPSYNIVKKLITFYNNEGGKKMTKEKFIKNVLSIVEKQLNDRILEQFDKFKIDDIDSVNGIIKWSSNDKTNNCNNSGRIETNIYI